MPTELGAFVTLFHARVDTGTGRVDYVDAGHGLTLHLRADGGVERLWSRDMPLGIQNPTAGFSPRSVVLQPGDTLVSVTDGALDVYDSTLASLDRIAAELRGQPSVGEFLDGLAARIAVSTVDDDVTVLVITLD
jgi:serine phosphatase RsbU (regulator of sigma subunit)